MFFRDCSQVETQEAVDNALPTSTLEATERAEVLPTVAATSQKISTDTGTRTPFISDILLSHDLLWLRSGDDEDPKPIWEKLALACKNAIGGKVSWYF